MKTKTYDFKEFMRGEHKKDIKPPVMSLIPLATAPLWQTIHTSAATDVGAQMMTAFDPIIDLIQGMAYPVAMIVVLGGALFVMIGNSEKGFAMMQRSAMGYVLISLLPMIFDVLVNAMKGVV